MHFLKPTENMWFMATFGAAFILVLGAVGIQRSGSRGRRLQRETLRRGIDLKELQRTLINYGFQPPLIETRGLRSQMLKLSRRSEIANEAPLVLIQHFDGAEVLIRCEGIGKDFHLQKGHLARIDFAASDINRQVVFVPLEESSESTSYVLVHMIVNE